MSDTLGHRDQDSRSQERNPGKACFHVSETPNQDWPYEDFRLRCSAGDRCWLEVQEAVGAHNCLDGRLRTAGYEGRQS